MKLSDLIQPFDEIISQRWEMSCEMEDCEYADYHSYDCKTKRYEMALKYLLKRKKSFYAIITIVDEDGHQVMYTKKKEVKQYDMPLENCIMHEFYIGAFAIPEYKEIKRRIQKS